MWKSDGPNAKLVSDISRVLVEEWAPDEIDLHSDLANSFAKRELFTTKSRGIDAMGMGIGDIFAIAALQTPLLIAVAEWAAKEMLGKPIAELSAAAIKKRLNSNSPAAPTIGDMALRIKLADSLLDHLAVRAAALGVESAKIKAICDRAALELIPLIESALTATKSEQN